jgi:FAD synthetase
MEPKKIVLVGGCFDFIHFGHISFLKKAKSFGNYLIVMLESDENVRKTKGETRPIHTQKQRREMLESLTFVDEVISLPPMNQDQEYYNLVSKIKPSIIAVTEGDPMMDKKMEQAKETGATSVIIEKVHVPSTSQLAKLLGVE